MKEETPWKLVSSRIAYENPWMRIREDSVITPTGNPGVYGVMESNDSVIIVVLNEHNEVYFVRTFRYPAQAWKWELPGGGGDKQDSLTASKRELEEETGIQAHTWEKLGETTVCSGLMTERMTICLARDLTFTGKQEISDEQISDRQFVPLTEIDAMIERGEIDEGQSITALYYLKLWLDRQTR